MIFEGDCNMTAPTNAGGGPENFSETLTADHDKSVKMHELGSLQVAIREADLQDYWEVADTHCGAFLPDLGFPMDMLLRFDRVVAMLGGFSLPIGRKRKCLVAVDGKTHAGLKRVGFSLGDLLLAWTSFERGARHDLNVETILGIVTVDTVAEFLPRRKTTGLRRIGIAYISNVAVRQRVRRRGIAKKLVQEAELVATCWGCRSIALHCDVNNPGALALYSGAGYRLVKAPSGAKWPQPKPMSGSEFYLMMKRLPSKQALACEPD